MVGHLTNLKRKIIMNDKKIKLRNLLKLYYINEYPMLTDSDVEETFNDCNQSEEIGLQRNHALCITNDDGDVLGGSVLAEMGNILMLKYLIVDDVVRGMGYGTKIMSEVLKLSIELNKGLVINVSDKEKQTIFSFYSSLGYDVIFKQNQDDPVYRVCNKETYEIICDEGVEPYSIKYFDR